jgi:hypothetical protein
MGCWHRLKLGNVRFAALVLLAITATLSGSDYSGTPIQVNRWHRWVLGMLEEDGTLQVIDTTLTYTEPQHPEENFTIGCDAFESQSSTHHGTWLYVTLTPKKTDSFTDSNKQVAEQRTKRRNVKGTSIRDELLTGCQTGRVRVSQAIEARKAQAARDAESARERAASEAEMMRQQADRDARLAADFRNGILTAWKAAGEPEPFASIRGKFNLSSPTAAWLTNLQLPFADECSLFKIPASGADSAWIYACRFDPTGTWGSRASYEKIIDVVQSTLSLKFQPDEGAQDINQVFFSDASKPAYKLMVSKLNPFRIVLSIAPQRSTATLPFAKFGDDKAISAPSPSNIDAAIAQALSRGPTSALPARQVSQSGTPGITTLSITNNTQYNLRILASGPSSGDYTIPPGTTQDITVTPGSYKVFGSVAANDVLPFYGTETYASGTKYIYRFYIQ